VSTGETILVNSRHVVIQGTDSVSLLRVICPTCGFGARAIKYPQCILCLFSHRKCLEMPEG